MSHYETETLPRNDGLVHPGVMVVDTHNDTMMRVVDPETWMTQVNIGADTPFHVDILKMRRGGLNVPFFAAYSPGYPSHHRNTRRTLALLNALHWTVKANSDSRPLPGPSRTLRG